MSEIFLFSKKHNGFHKLLVLGEYIVLSFFFLLSPRRDNNTRSRCSRNLELATRRTLDIPIYR